MLGSAPLARWFFISRMFPREIAAMKECCFLLREALCVLGFSRGSVLQPATPNIAVTTKRIRLTIKSSLYLGEKQMDQLIQREAFEVLSS